MACPWTFFPRSRVKFNDLRSGLVGMGPRSALFFHLLRCIHDGGYSPCLERVLLLDIYADYVQLVALAFIILSGWWETSCN